MPGQILDKVYTVGQWQGGFFKAVSVRLLAAPSSTAPRESHPDPRNHGSNAVSMRVLQHNRVHSGQKSASAIIGYAANDPTATFAARLRCDAALAASRRFPTVNRRIRETNTASLCKIARSQIRQGLLFHLRWKSRGVAHTFKSLRNVQHLREHGRRNRSVIPGYVLFARDCSERNEPPILTASYQREGFPLISRSPNSVRSSRTG